MPRCGCSARRVCGSCSGPDFPHDGLYKFRVHGADGSVTDRADPMAFATEVPPHTASRVTVSDYRWSDDAWMTARAKRNPVFEPMSTYEVHLGSWRPGLSYRDLARELTDYVLAQGLPTSSCCPSPSIRSADRGDIRSRPTTRRHRDSARPTSSGRSSTRCTRPVSASSWTGSPPTSPRTRGRSAVSTAHRSTSIPTPDAASNSTGALTCSTSAAPRCATSWWPTRCTGSRNSTSTACESTPSRRCSTSTTPARQAAGRRTSTAAGKTWRPCSSCRR